MNKERVKLDEVLKFLFSTSHDVLVKLLNGIFNESFEVDEVDIAVSNNEFIEDDLGVLRGDLFFDLVNRSNDKISYHIELQTKNDSTMIVRMFEYGFKKGKEQESHQTDKQMDMKTIYLPKQKVIFFEENKNIEDSLKLRLVFPDKQEVIYSVDVMKYWKYTREELREKQMYPLLPLQLFGLRKELEKASQQEDIQRLKELSYQLKELASQLAYESKVLFESEEILGEDFHKMLLAVQNLIEYLNRNYLNDKKLEDEVIKMTKTLYDPEVEKRGRAEGREEGIKEKQIESAKKMLKKGFSMEDIMEITGLTMQEIDRIQGEL